MTNTALPPLPEPAYTVRWDTITQSAYTADQMHAYAQEAVRAALASKPDARMHAREAAEDVKSLRDRIIEGELELDGTHPPTLMFLMAEHWRAVAVEHRAKAADYDRIKHELRMARAALASSPQSPPVVAPVTPDVEGLKTLAHKYGQKCCVIGVASCRGNADAKKQARKEAEAARDAMAAAIDALAQRAADSHDDYMRLLREKQQAGIDALSAHGVKQPEPSGHPVGAALTPTDAPSEAIRPTQPLGTGDAQ